MPTLVEELIDAVDSNDEKAVIVILSKMKKYQETLESRNSLAKKYNAELNRNDFIIDTMNPCLTVNGSDTRPNSKYKTLTALMVAASKGNPKIVALLRLAGADPNQGNPACVEWIFCWYDAGTNTVTFSNNSLNQIFETVRAFFEPEKFFDSENQENKSSNSAIFANSIQITSETIQKALAIAARNKLAEVVKYLVSKGADVKAISMVTPITSYARTALHGAISQGVRGSYDQEVLSTLEALGKQIDVNQRTIFDCDCGCKETNDQTPLIAFSGFTTSRVLLLKYLVANNADVNLRDKHGRTAFFHAARTNGIDNLHALLEAKTTTPNLNLAHDETGNTPLHEALRLKHIDLAKVLVQHGADVTLLNKAKISALQLTIQLGDAVFLDAQLKTLTNKLKTPQTQEYLQNALFTAIRLSSNNIAIIELLLPLIDNLDAKDGNNKTFCDYASKLVQRMINDEKLKRQKCHTESGRILELIEEEEKHQLKVIATSKKNSTGRMEAIKPTADQKADCQEMQALQPDISLESKLLSHAQTQFADKAAAEKNAIQLVDSVMQAKLEDLQKLSGESLAKILVHVIDIEVEQSLQAFPPNELTERKADALFAYIAPKTHKIYSRLLEAKAVDAFFSKCDQAGAIALHHATSGSNDFIAEVIIEQLLKYAPFTQLNAKTSDNKKAHDVVPNKKGKVYTLLQKKSIQEQAQILDLYYYVFHKLEKGIGKVTESGQANRLAHRIVGLRQVCNFASGADNGVRSKHTATIEEVIKIFADLTQGSANKNLGPLGKYFQASVCHTIFLGLLYLPSQSQFEEEPRVLNKLKKEFAHIFMPFLQIRKPEHYKKLCAGMLSFPVKKDAKESTQVALISLSKLPAEKNDVAANALAISGSSSLGLLPLPTLVPMPINTISTAGDAKSESFVFVKS